MALADIGQTIATEAQNQIDLETGFLPCSGTVSLRLKTPPQRGINIILLYSRKPGESSILDMMKPRRVRILEAMCVLAWAAACVPATALPTLPAEPTPATSTPLPIPPPLQPGATIRFEKISIEEGLSQSVVTAMAQDKTGFLWFGTTDGLNRYDGYDFTIYKPDPSDPGSLTDGWITSLLADEDGSLWVGTSQGGLNHYDSRTGKFVHYQQNPDDETSLTGGSVSVIYRDRQSNLWVGTSEGLNRFDSSTNGFVHFLSQVQDPTSISNNTITAILQDSDGRLWLGTNKGLNLYRPADGSFSHYVSIPDNPATLSHDRVSDVVQDLEGNLWVGTAQGLNRLNPDTGQFVRYVNNPSDKNSPVTDMIDALYVDRSGILWIGTVVGLDRFDPVTQQFRHFHSNPLVPGSLSADVTCSMLQDREGVIWFGTWGGGVSKYDPFQNQFGYYGSDPDDPGTLSSGGVFPIFVDTDGIAWMGVYGQGLQQFDPKTGHVTHFINDPQNPDSLGADSVWSIFRDRGGTLWLGVTGGLVQFDEENNRFVHYKLTPIDPSNPNPNNVGQIYEDRAGHLWIGASQGLYQFDRTSHKFIAYGDPYGEDDKTPTGISHIAGDHLGNLWISTQGMGLYYLDVFRGTFSRFTHTDGEANSLPDNIILWSYEDPQGILWIATAGNGISRFDLKTQAFSAYTEKQGLANNFVYCIIPDDAGHLWMATNHGVSQFDPVQQTFRNYSVEDGLQSNEFNSYACAHAADGSLYVGGLGGFNRFFPNALVASKFQPPIALTSFAPEGGAASAQAAAVQDVTLRAPNNSFAFEFAALSFSQPQRTQYAYKLDGFDTDWILLGAKRDSRYTNLPGGQYSLRLRATNRDGTWSESSTPIRLMVIPPFWQTSWFAALSVLIVGAAIYGIYRLRVQTVESQKAELERQVKERTLEIEKLFEQTKELAIIEERNRLARELHDSAKQKAFAALAQLGTASGLFKQNAVAAEAHISEAENLVYDVIQELTFLIQEMYPLALQEKGLALVLREYAFEWENRTDIRAAVHMENAYRLPIQVEQALYRIAQEALANIARHSQAKHADITVLYEPGRVALIVSDDGQGFDQSQKPKGMGLRSIRERAESVGGNAVITSVPGRGTRIEITIALKSEEIPQGV